MAKTEVKKYGYLRSPKGILGFGYLTKPDMKFGAKHRVQIFVDPTDPEVKAFASKLRETKVKHLALVGKVDDKAVPGLKKADEHLAKRFADRGVKIGSPYFEFDSHARLIEGSKDDYIPVAIYDATGKEAPGLKPWGGDVIRASVSVCSYESNGKHGVKAYLNAVQLIVSNGGGRGAIFEDETNGVGLEEVTEAIDPFSTEADEVADTTATKPAASASKTTKAGPSQGETPMTSPSDEASSVNLEDLM